MRKKKVTKELSLQEHLQQYDPVTMTAMIEAMASSPMWDIFRAYLKLRQREFEIASLDLIKYGKTHEASNASGYAQAMNDVADNLMLEFANLALGKSALVENPRPEERFVS